MKKYELLKDDTKIMSGRTLYRIKSVRDFGNVKKAIWVVILRAKTI